MTSHDSDPVRRWAGRLGIHHRHEEGNIAIGFGVAPNFIEYIPEMVDGVVEARVDGMTPGFSGYGVSVDMEMPGTYAGVTLVAPRRYARACPGTKPPSLLSGRRQNRLRLSIRWNRSLSPRPAVSALGSYPSTTAKDSTEAKLPAASSALPRCMGPASDCIGQAKPPI